MQDADFVLQVLLHHVELVLLDRFRAVILFDALAGEDLHADDDALDARGADKGGVAHVAGLFAEDRAEQFLFRRQLCLALGRDLADQDVARLDGRADADDAAVVEVPQVAFRHVRDVAGDFFRPELGVARFDFKLLDMDRGVVIVANHLLRHQDGVFEVVTTPGHKGHQHVAAQRQFAQFRARTVREDLALLHPLAFTHNRLLIDARVLVRALELGQRINIRAHVFVDVRLRLDAHHDARAVDEVDHAGTTGHGDGTRIAGGNVFHAGAHVGRLRAEQRNGLALHVRAHQCAVRVVVLEERHERSGDGHELLGRDVNELHLLARREDEVTGLAGIDTVRLDPHVLVQLDVGLGDDEVVFFPRRQVEAVRLELDALLLGAAIGTDQFVGLDDFAVLVFRMAAGIRHQHIVDDVAVLDLAVRRLDEPELVDPGIRRQRRNQPDVRAFRRLNRADAAVVSGVDVADFEARALA